MEGVAAPPLGPPNLDADGQDQLQDQDNDNNAPDDNQGILLNWPAPQPHPALPTGPPILPAPQPAQLATVFSMTATPSDNTPANG